MRESRSRVRLSWLLGTIVLAAVGCAAVGPRGAAFTRRGVERDFISSQVFGAPRGLTFADIIPVGARITAVHVGVDGGRVTSIWTSYERNGVSKDTPHRGHTGRNVEVLELRREEKIIGIHASGGSEIQQLTIATNMRMKSFGSGSAAPESSTWFDTLSEDDRHRYVGVGFTGRADRELHQLGLRIQVRRDEIASAR